MRRGSYLSVEVWPECVPIKMEIKSNISREIYENYTNDFGVDFHVISELLG